MTLPFAQHFDARLPGLTLAVRIASLHDAQIFTRRWVIRDKDLKLKALLRKLERANSTAGTDAAIDEFRQALHARGLLGDAAPAIAAAAGPRLKG